MEYLIKFFDLQLFADGGAGGAGSGAGTGVAGAAGSDGGQAAAVGTEANTAERGPLARGRRRENPLANVTYGKQENTAQPATVQTTEAATEDQTSAQESFEDLIKGRFKGDFESRVQGILQDRLRGSREREAKLNPILEKIAQRYGIEAAEGAKIDLDALNDAIDNDVSQYEEEALEKGIPADTLAKIKKLERIEAVQQREAQQNQQRQEIERHLQDMIRQEAEVKKIYPNFNLQAELQNPVFVRLTAPGVGVGVRTAYEVVHRDEMRGAEMQFAAQKSAQRISASVQANGRRPAENGMNGSVGATNKSDPTKFTKEDRAEIRRRVRNGEKIVF